MKMKVFLLMCFPALTGFVIGASVGASVNFLKTGSDVKLESTTPVPTSTYESLVFDKPYTYDAHRVAFFSMPAFDTSESFIFYKNNEGMMDSLENDYWFRWRSENINGFQVLTIFKKIRAQDVEQSPKDVDEEIEITFTVLPGGLSLQSNQHGIIYLME